MEKPLSSTLEDYLEAIYHLERNKRTARVRDIAASVGVTKSTVNSALKSLAAKGLVNYEPYELIALTETGRNKAADVVMSHEILLRFLTDVLGIEDEKAEEAACRMEHAVDRLIIERLACFLAFVRKSADAEDSWISDFRKSILNGPDDRTREDCMKDCLTRFKVDTDY